MSADAEGKTFDNISAMLKKHMHIKTKSDNDSDLFIPLLSRLINSVLIYIKHKLSPLTD